MSVYSFAVTDYVDPEVVPHAYGLDLGLAALLALAVVGARGVWLVGGLVCLLLALGPVLQPTDVPLPFALFAAWPPLAQFRTPYRLAMPAVLGLSVVLGILLARGLVRWPVSVRSGVVCALILARLGYALVHDPLATQTYPGYALYDRLADDGGDGAVLEVPFGVRSGLERVGSGGEVLQYYQSEHGRPLVSGMVARVPSRVFSGYRAHGALRLLAGESVDPAEARRDLPDVLTWTNTAFVVVHHAMLDADQARAIDNLLDNEPALQRVGDEADLSVYRVARQTIGSRY
jgi:hypothetical protein